MKFREVTWRRFQCFLIVNCWVSSMPVWRTSFFFLGEMKVYFFCGWVLLDRRVKALRRTGVRALGRQANATCKLCLLLLGNPFLCMFIKNWLHQTLLKLRVTMWCSSCWCSQSPWQNVHLLTFTILFVLFFLSGMQMEYLEVMQPPSYQGAVCRRMEIHTLRMAW